MLRNEAIYQKSLAIHTKKKFKEIKGISHINFNSKCPNYQIISELLSKTYSINKTNTENIILETSSEIEIIDFLEGEIIKDDIYYISIEGLIFVSFKITNIDDFVRTWKKINKSIEIELFSETEVIVIIEDELDFRVIVEILR